MKNDKNDKNIFINEILIFEIIYFLNFDII